MLENTIHSKFLIHWTGGGENDFDHHDENEVMTLSDEIRGKYIDRLRNDLQNGLYMKLGEEKIFGVNDTYIQAKIARVCFTEIKLSQIEKHARRYGRLGIGFNRDFVLEREGNPVFYVQNGNKGHIIENFDFLRSFLEKLPNSENKNRQIKQLEIILGYLKNMSDSNENELKYYDEMEWRIVHIDRLTGTNNYIHDDGEKTKDGKNIFRLKVQPKDIQLIVFPDNETMKLALASRGFHDYFHSYLPALIALDDCKNF